MDDMEEIEVLVNGREERWPKREYLDYKAWQYGFEDYDDFEKLLMDFVNDGFEKVEEDVSEHTRSRPFSIHLNSFPYSFP